MVNMPLNLLARQMWRDLGKGTGRNEANPFGADMATSENFLVSQPHKS